MADLTDLLNRLPIDDLAKKVGASPDDVRAAAAAALPTMVAGLAAQTGSEESTTTLAGALEKHDDGLADGAIDVDEVDTDDGQKIVGKLFGENEDTVAKGISGAVPAAAVDQGLVKKLLPLLAPIVLSYVMSQYGGGNKGGAQTGGGLGDLLGGMLGGGNGKSSGGGLGDILGSVLGGGGDKKGGDNPLGSILGSILGGK